MKKKKLCRLFATAMAAMQIVTAMPVLASNDVTVAVRNGAVEEEDRQWETGDTAQAEDPSDVPEVMREDFLEENFPSSTVEVTDDGRADGAEMVTITTITHLQGADGKEIGTRTDTRSSAKGAWVYYYPGNVAVGYAVEKMVCRYVGSDGTALTEEITENDRYYYPFQTYGDMTVEEYFTPSEVARLHVIEILCDENGNETARVESAVKEYNKKDGGSGFYSFSDVLPEGYYCTGVEIKDAAGNHVTENVSCSYNQSLGGWFYRVGKGDGLAHDLYVHVSYQYRPQELCRIYQVAVTEHFLDENGREMASNMLDQVCYTPTASLTEQIPLTGNDSWGRSVMQYFGSFDHITLNQAEKESVTYADLNAGAVNQIDYYYKAQSTWDNLEVVKRYTESSREYVEIGEDDDKSDYWYDIEQDKYYILHETNKELKSYVRADVAGLNGAKQLYWCEADQYGSSYTYGSGAVAAALCVLTDTDLEGYKVSWYYLDKNQADGAEDYGRARLVIEYIGDDEPDTAMTLPHGKETTEVKNGTLTVRHHLLDGGGNEVEVKTYTKKMTLEKEASAQPAAVSMPGYQCSRYTYSSYEKVWDDETESMQLRPVTGESTTSIPTGDWWSANMYLYGDSVYDFYYTPMPDVTLTIQEHYWDFAMKTEYASSTRQVTVPYGAYYSAAYSTAAGFALKYGGQNNPYAAVQQKYTADKVIEYHYCEVPGSVQEYHPSIRYAGAYQTAETSYMVCVKDHYTVNGVEQVKTRWELSLAAGASLNALPDESGCTKAVYQYYGADGNKKEESVDNPSQKKLDIYGVTTVDFYYQNSPTDSENGGGNTGNQNSENQGGSTGSQNSENQGGSTGNQNSENQGGSTGGNNGGSEQNTVSYTVTFNKNGGSKLSNTSLVVKSGGTIQKMPTVQRKKYTFLGWYTKKSGGTEVTVKTAITGNQTLYAHWKKTAAPKAANKPTLKNSKKGQIAVTYKTVTGGASGYEIQYSTGSKFKKSSVVTTKTKKATIKNLKKGSTYYVRVRAYNLDSAQGKIYGKYSKSVKLKLKK